jgi:hypothetical protein
MYMAEGGAEVEPMGARPHLFATLLATAIGAVLLGIFPSSAYELARASFEPLLR